MKYVLFMVLFLNGKANALTREELFSQILSANPMIKEEEAVLKSIESEPSLKWAAPEISISEMNSATPFTDSEMKMQRSFEISQMFPNPFQIKASTNVKKQSVETQKWQKELVYKNIKQKSYQIFLNIYQMQKENELLMSKKKQLYILNDRLKSTQVQGQEEKLQLDEVRNELSEISLTIKTTENKIEWMKQMLNQMMGKPLGTKISDPILSEFNALKDTSFDNTEIKLINSNIGLMEADLAMVKSEQLPEFSIKARLNKNYTMGGVDSKEIMLGVTLPFVFWNQSIGSTNSKEHKIEAMKLNKINRQEEFNVQLSSLKSELNDLNITLKFLQDTVLPNKEKKLSLYLNYSHVEMKSFMNYKMSLDEVYMIKMKILQGEVDQQKKQYEILSLVEG